MSANRKAFLSIAFLFLSACTTPTVSPPTETATIRSAAPQDLTIPTHSGTLLDARYYPAAETNAPVIVLMHWSGGSLEDWDVIARWLQNRGQQVAGDEARPWTASSWFPALDPERSYAVLAFNYRHFANGNLMLQDSTDALTFASTLPGIDAERIIAIGASIGADGAVDGCYLFNRAVARGEAVGFCAGALSLSPVDYLSAPFTYSEAVTALGEDDVIVYCLAAREDGNSPHTCNGAEAANYRAFVYEDTAHGMALIDPQFDTLELLLDFLNQITR